MWWKPTFTIGQHTNTKSVSDQDRSKQAFIQTLSACSSRHWRSSVISVWCFMMAQRIDWSSARLDTTPHTLRTTVNPSSPSSAHWQDTYKNETRRWILNKERENKTNIQGQTWSVDATRSRMFKSIRRLQHSGVSSVMFQNSVQCSRRISIPCCPKIWAWVPLGMVERCTMLRSSTPLDIKISLCFELKVARSVAQMVKVDVEISESRW